MQTTERVRTLQHPKEVKAVVENDLLACLLFNSLAQCFSKTIEAHALISPSLQNNFAQVQRTIEIAEQRTKQHSGISPILIDRAVNNAVLVDAATLILLIHKIGLEEGQEEYAEIFNLITSTVDAVLYAQKNRKKLHFGKYKALLRLISQEITNDTNKSPSQFVYRINSEGKGELFMRTTQPEQEPKIEDHG